MRQTTDLFAKASDNATPTGAVAGTLEANDGLRLRYGLFRPIGRPLRGTVILLQGRNECIEKYFETINDLSAAGYGVAAMDWRGQGGSERMLKDPEKGHIDDFHTYAADLDLFLHQVVLPDCRPPYYVVGHSTGSLIALLASPRLSNQVERMVLVAPLLAFGGNPAAARRLVLATRVLTALGLGALTLRKKPLIPKPFAGNVLTSDKDRFQRNMNLWEANPGLFVGTATMAWLNAASRAMDEVADPDYMRQLRIPTLIIAAGADAVVSTPAIEHYGRRMRSGSVLTIDGARHEILQEADIYREPLLAAALAFFKMAD